MPDRRGAPAAATPSRKLARAEKVARAAARIIDAIGPETVQHARETTWITGSGGQHYTTNSRLVALADAVEAWRDL